jgi:hypothetical protein
VRCLRSHSQHALAKRDGPTAAQPATIDEIHREIDARQQPWRTEMDITKQELATF